MGIDEDELEETLPVRSFPVPKARERATVSRKARPSGAKTPQPRRQSATAFQDELKELVTGLAQHMDAIERAPSSHHQASKPPVRSGTSTPPTLLGARVEAGDWDSLRQSSRTARGTEDFTHPGAPASQGSDHAERRVTCQPPHLTPI